MKNNNNLQIEGRILKESDIHSKVTYVPLHAEGNAGHKDCEGGIITSWNDCYIFVNYGKGHSNATRPEDLVWG